MKILGILSVIIVCLVFAFLFTMDDMIDDGFTVTTENETAPGILLHNTFNYSYVFFSTTFDVIDTSALFTLNTINSTRNFIYNGLNTTGYAMTEISLDVGLINLTFLAFPVILLGYTIIFVNEIIDFVLYDVVFGLIYFSYSIFNSTLSYVMSIFDLPYETLRTLPNIAGIFVLISFLYSIYFIINTIINIIKIIRGVPSNEQA